MRDILEYRRTSLEFRRLASNMLNTNYTEGNLHLIRLKIYIDENELISDIITNKIKDVEYDYRTNFISKDGGWCSLNIPINSSEHIKAIYDYLTDMTKEEKDIRGTARGFYCDSNSWNDIVRNYLEKVFKPLVDFIIDSLSMEMMIMEPEKAETHIHQNIGTNYGTANIAERDINSVNNTNIDGAKEIVSLIAELKKMIEDEKIDQEIKDDVIDDLETVQEQVESKEPKFVKLKKAYQGLKNFIASIPDGIVQATLIVTKLNDLTQKIHSFMGLIK
jgi:cell division FtsZ-interacting protein ZapD